MEMEQVGQRTSKIIPGMEETVVQGLQYRRNSRKLSLTLTNEIQPKKLRESPDPDSMEELVPYAPDGGYGWIIVLSSFLCNFVLDGISLSQASLMTDIREASGLVNSPTILDSHDSNSTTSAPAYFASLKTEPEYNITVGMYSLVSSVLLCVTLSVGPFISILTDRFGFRAVSMCGSILASLGIFLSFAVSPYTPNIWAFIAFFGILSGIGFGMMFQPSIVIVGIYFEKWRPLATGIAIAGTGAGTFAFPPLLTEISRLWGWQGAYIFQAGIALLSTLFAFFYCPLPTKLVKIDPKVAETHRSGLRLTTGEGDAVEVNIKSMWKAMGPLSKSPTFLLISISGTITMLGFFAPFAFLQDKAESELIIDDPKAAALLKLITAIGIANTVGRLVFGLISSHPLVNSLILSNSALTVAGLATICVPYTTAYYQLVLYAIIFGFGIAIFTVLRSILVLKFMGIEKFNNAFGLSLLFMGVGTFLGNTIGGFLKDATGNYDISFFAAGGYLLLSGVMCYPLQQISNWENRRHKNTVHETIPGSRKSLVL